MRIAMRLRDGLIPSRLCWFDTLAGMQLQAAASLDNPVWTHVPFAPGTNCVEVPLTSSNTMFRLVLPQ
jgi:hypothetical protein